MAYYIIRYKTDYKKQSANYDDSDASCCLRSHDEGLLNVGCLGRPANERTELVLRIELNALVSLVHVVDNVALVKHDDKIL